MESLFKYKCNENVCVELAFQENTCSQEIPAPKNFFF